MVLHQPMQTFSAPQIQSPPDIETAIPATDGPCIEKEGERQQTTQQVLSNEEKLDHALRAIRFEQLYHFGFRCDFDFVYIFFQKY